MSSVGTDVVIVGGGLIGLASALELAQRGAMVRVFELGEPGRAASWAGAGMLAPYSEQVADDELIALCASSLARYPEFVAMLRERSGVDPKLRLDGIAHAAFDDDTAAKLHERQGALARRGIAATVLDRRDAALACPSLSPRVVGAMVVHGEGHVDNRRLGRALLAACRSAGVNVVERVDDLAVECDARRVLGVRTHLGFTPATHVAIAAGAWSARVRGLPDAAIPAVEPVKGQMLALGVPREFMAQCTWVPGAYLVPRDDGRLLVGATMERSGFDTRVTAGAIRSLLDAALDAAPSLREFALLETWAGLRPMSADGRPFIGATPFEGLHLATGHGRNGILLTPQTAVYLADAIEQRPEQALAPWSPLRMTHARARMERV